ncbi:MAG TPA: hypothetical protein VHJ18_20910 [Streptosporangiaceae bacterium]|nr:hypothetical protein [Streptosporangiaceae bacterium]
MPARQDAGERQVVNLTDEIQAALADAAEDVDISGARMFPYW